jgi:hypothetical protein
MLFVSIESQKTSYTSYSRNAVASWQCYKEQMEQWEGCSKGQCHNADTVVAMHQRSDGLRRIQGRQPRVLRQICPCLRAYFFTCGRRHCCTVPVDKHDMKYHTNHSDRLRQCHVCHATLQQARIVERLFQPSRGATYQHTCFAHGRTHGAYHVGQDQVVRSRSRSRSRSC